jgi:F-type H+-transporting ATPase subunit beta
MDNVFRFVQAGSEVSSLLGRVPSAVGYQPTLAEEMGQLQERITSTKKALSPRCRLFMCRPTTSPTQHQQRPLPTSTQPSCSRATWHLLVFTRLSTRLRVTHRARPDIVGEEHYRVALETKQVLQRYKDLAGHHRILVSKSFQTKTSSWCTAHARSSASSRSPCTWQKSSRVSRACMCRSQRRCAAFREILDGKHDDKPEAPSIRDSPSPKECLRFITTALPSFCKRPLFGRVPTRGINKR